MPSKITFPPTPEQEAIIAAAKAGGNIMVRAGAGCAKSTTLEMIAWVSQGVPALGVAFNVSTKKELERRFPSNFSIKTLNGLGHSAWAKAINRMPRIDEKKLGKLVSETLKEVQNEYNEEDWDITRRLVTAAMHAGLVPSYYPMQSIVPDTPEQWLELSDMNFLEASRLHIDVAREVLIKNIKLSYEGVISYDDQIYMSALFSGVFPRFPLVLVDEAQDLSVLNHIQIKRSAADRLVVVGDKAQSIYAFRGADYTSMDKLKSLRKEWKELPLLTTFRCPKAIVARQQAHVPGFTAAPSNPEGSIVRLYPPEGTPEGEWSWNWETIQGHLPSPEARTFVLCRNNAPLLALAFKLIRAGVGCAMLGRDIGKNLVALSKKIIPDDTLGIEVAKAAISAWMDKEIQLAMVNEKEEKIAGIEDRGQCLLATAEGSGARTAGELRSAIKDLFSKENARVELATGHRAKGLEREAVLHLDPWRIPSKYARRAASAGHRGQLEQELNLKYVIETRTKHTYIEASLEDFEDAAPR